MAASAAGKSSTKTLAPRSPPTLPAEDLFVYVYVLIDDAIAARDIAIAPRPGPGPACSDAELLTVALVRHLLGRRSEAGFAAEAARDWPHLFPALPHEGEASRRIRWLRGASGRLREALAAATVPLDDCQQAGHLGAAGQAFFRGSRPGRLDGAERPACAVRPRRRARRVVLRLPPGDQD